jgi:hypothetical protein
MRTVRAVAAVAVVVSALVVSACATGGPAGGSRTRCSEDGPGDATRPLVSVFCIQSP